VGELDRIKKAQVSSGSPKTGRTKGLGGERGEKVVRGGKTKPYPYVIPFTCSKKEDKIKEDHPHGRGGEKEPSPLVILGLFWLGQLKKTARKPLKGKLSPPMGVVGNEIPNTGKTDNQR